MSMTGHQLDAFFEAHTETGDQPFVVAIIDHNADPATTRYYNVEFPMADSNPPVVPDGTLVLYLGAELTV